ncbi:hypothetical protein ACF07U_16215 [Streptomyces californicus]|uniref:hypothetical protein n=1 Tax=Streptomyces californicus TaxID=67351 RepID=UPI0036F87C60
MDTTNLALDQCLIPADVTPCLRDRLVDCWVEVTNAGGAAGFPFPPVDMAEVALALDRVIDDLDPDTGRLITAHEHGRLASRFHEAGCPTGGQVSEKCL